MVLFLLHATFNSYVVIYIILGKLMCMHSLGQNSKGLVAYNMEDGISVLNKHVQHEHVGECKKWALYTWGQQ
jgi:hypothetical protein